MKKFLRSAKLLGLGLATFSSFSLKAQQVVSTFSGYNQGHSFHTPYGIVKIGSDFYVTERYENAVTKVNSSGVATVIYDTYEGDETGLFNPTGMAVDGTGKLVIADTENYWVKTLTTAGVLTELNPTALYKPEGIAIDGSGNIYIADTENHRIIKRTSGGTYSVFAGSTSSYPNSPNAGHFDATGTNARFYRPKGLCLDGSGNLYVADFENDVIRKITSGGSVTTFGTGINGPIGIARDPSTGTFYITGNHAIYTLPSSGGTASPYAGQAGNPGYTDGALGLARFSDPQGIVLSGSDIYIADGSNGVIRKISTSSTSGSNAGTAIDLGTIPHFGYVSNTQTNTGSGNDYTTSNTNGQSSEDIYYKFTLAASSKVTIYTCNDNGIPSYISDSYLHLLNSSQTNITSNDDRWSTPICGSSNYHAIIPSVTLAAGTYYVVTEGYGTNSGNITTTISVTCPSCTRQEEAAEAAETATDLTEELAVYPNPSSGVLNIDVNRPGSIVVVDIMGKEAYRTTANEYKSKVQLDLSALPKGLYNVKIEGGKTNKLVNLQ